MNSLRWTTKKPKIFQVDCLLLTASRWKDEDWNYTLFEIRKTDGEDEAGNFVCYWGIFKDGDEWGDYADLSAQKYAVIKPNDQQLEQDASAGEAVNWKAEKTELLTKIANLETFIDNFDNRHKPHLSQD